MTLTTLYDIAKTDDITVFAFDMNVCESISVLKEGNCYIAIDPFKIKNTSDEKVKLAHELGHCETGAFYNQYAVCDIREKHERRADKWAIKKLVPKDELKEACKWCHNVWELSEHFDVTQDFMQKALEFYKGRTF